MILEKDLMTEAYDYGKFIQIIDPEWNKIELRQPVESEFTKMGGKMIEYKEFKKLSKNQSNY